MEYTLEELQNRINYHFRQLNYLEQAVTHSSYANETGERNHHLRCNERLEFLGDSVLSLWISEALFRRFPSYPEGDLTKMRAALVCEESLAAYASGMELGSFLRFGKGETANGGAKKPAILADAFEAVLAAIYLDAGNDRDEAVSAFLTPFLEATVNSLPSGVVDSKSLLQDFLQKEGSGLPEYRVVSETGPDHAKHFAVEVYLNSNCIGKGQGTRKHQAEQEAAADALRLFGVVR